LIGSSATRKAGKQQARSADKATQLQREMFEQTRADQAPFQLGGYSANNALLALAGLPQVTSANIDQFLGTDTSAVPAKPLVADPGGFWGGIASRIAQPQQSPQATFGSYRLPTFSGTAMQQLAADPGYQFRMQQGQQALERSAAARGGLMSGRALKDTAAYSQDLASQEFGSRWNRLAGLTGAGQTATTNVGNYGQNFANQAGQNIQNAGNARASGYINQANAIGGGLNQLGQAAGYYFGGNKPQVNQYNMPGTAGSGGGSLNWRG
jgi:hypothetical protein